VSAADVTLVGSASSAGGPSRPRGPWLQALARFRRRPLGVAALLIVVGFAVVAGLAPSLAPYPPARLFLEYLNDPQAPSLHSGHLLGTDLLGHDLLSQLLYAIRETMIGALGCAIGATVIGVLVGAAAGYFGGAVDTAVSWLTGVVVTIPALVLLVLVVIYEAPVQNWLFPLTLALYLWTAVARAVRTSFATLRTREFVEAAHASGASSARVVFKHLLPNTAGTVIVAATAIIGQSIVIIATVDYFSYGNQQSERPTLGGLVANAAKGSVLTSTPWWLYAIPAVVLGLLLVCINFAGDTLDEALEPGRAS
jgi:ABC-type dipeptide/oligopeptide/nickel transport system permease subunit